jgi:MFS transporter, OFA family, oxalate/formate antiporter
MNNKKSTRWFVLSGAVMIQMCLGAVYAWSLFNKPLIDKFGWERSSVIFTFSITIAVFAFTTIFSGRLQDKIGPRWVATFGGILLGLGLILSSTASTLWELYLYYGVIGGIGIGSAYVCPVATCLKWFPKSKGFTTGIAVGAFGLGSLTFESIILNFLRNFGVSRTFLYIGIIYMLLVVIGAQLLSLPPKDYYSSGNNLSTDSTKEDFTPGQMIRTLPFYKLWIMYLLGCISGLMVIGLARDIGTELVNLSTDISARAVSVLALFNAGGRITWGILSDKIGRLKSFRFMFVLTTAAMLVLSTVSLNLFSFFLVIGIVAFSFGGFLAVFPAITSDYYGSKNIGANYGLMYQAYGIAAILGPMIGTSLGFIHSFLLAAGLSVVGLVISFRVK